ncbi:hypothetical protein [Azohydromonas caseinilytica]|uniref:Uncharacterized protein n=1 Tax=Azohydromonas caseinilytica TaxID=2728836 RepID=A0A848FCT0_9BURK|nr:hypothetical protein [Azohydromonas caseinilytica]NML18027.1 hypothetical protein [Azohydromonas caseinilytica]
MSSTHKSNSMNRVPGLSLGKFKSPDAVELCQRLQALHCHQPPEDPEAAFIRIGIEDPYGDLVHVVETTRLTEAVKVFETLADFGLVPGHGRCRAADGRTLVRTYRQPVRQAALPSSRPLATPDLGSAEADALAL